MKFQATVTFEFQAGSLIDAGRKLNDVVEHAHDNELEAKSVELRTPPGASKPVSLPALSGTDVPGPRASSADGSAS